MNLVDQGGDTEYQLERSAEGRCVCPPWSHLVINLGVMMKFLTWSPFSSAIHRRKGPEWIESLNISQTTSTFAHFSPAQGGKLLRVMDMVCRRFPPSADFLFGNN